MTNGSKYEGTKFLPLLSFILFIIFQLSANQVTAQKKIFTSSNNRKALDLYARSTIAIYDNKQEQAILYLKAAIKEDKYYIDAYMRLGGIYHKQKKYDLEEEQYINVINIEPKYPDAYYRYGMLLLNNKEFSVAQEAFNYYLDVAKYNKEYYNEVKHQIAVCQFRENALKNPIPFKPINLGSVVNTNLDEYWGVLTADNSTIYFTRKLEIDTVVINEFFKYNEDIFFSRLSNGKWTKPSPVPGFLNSKNNEGAIAISPDGRFLLFTGCQRDDSYGRCDIYYSEFHNGEWQVPRNIGPPINTKDKETQASISYDGKTIYFSSNRKGTLGGLDIWKSERLENGKWSLPVNLGKNVNSIGDEQSSFIHPDNTTLFFSSNGKIGMGNSDIFISKKNAEGAFEEAKNLGYPINTENFEYSLFVTADGKKPIMPQKKKEVMENLIFMNLICMTKSNLSRSYMLKAMCMIKRLLKSSRQDLNFSISRQDSLFTNLIPRKNPVNFLKHSPTTKITQ